MSTGGPDWAEWERSLNGGPGGRETFPCHVHDQWRAGIQELLDHADARASRSRALHVGGGTVIGWVFGAVVGAWQQLPAWAVVAVSVMLGAAFAVAAARLLQENRDHAIRLRAFAMIDRAITGGPHDGPQVQAALATAATRALADVELRSRMGWRMRRAMRRREDHR